jgi:hypothetical protein
LSEIEHRLTQNKRKQEIVATVAKRHRDPGVDELFELITKEPVAVAYDRRKRKGRRS